MIKKNDSSGGRFTSSSPVIIVPLAEVGKKWGAKAIREVVEVAEENERKYSIKIEDELAVWVLEASTNGVIRESLKFKK